MSGNKTDFFKQMRMIVEGHSVLVEEQNGAVAGILVRITRAMGAENEVLPLLAAGMKGQSTTIQEGTLSEGRDWIKNVVSAIIGLAIALGGGAIYNIVQRMGGGVPEEHRVYDVPMGSSITGEYQGYRDGRLRESSSSFFHRMKAIVEGAYNPSSGVIALLVELIQAIGAKEDFVAAAEDVGMSEAVLEESGNRRGIIAALVALILACGAMVADKVGVGLSGVDDWQPIFDSSGGVAAWRNERVYDPGRPE